MTDWQNDPAYSEENIMAILGRMGNAPEPRAKPSPRKPVSKPNLKAAELVKGKGMAFANLFAQQEHNTAVTSGNVAKASYWQAVIVRLTQIEAEENGSAETPALRAV